MAATPSYVTTPFLGMRGTGRWGEGQEPDTWRKSILYTNPNGATTLTGILSMTSQETAPSYMWNWHTMRLPMMGGRLQTEGDVYTDTGLNTQVTAGAAAGTQIYVKMIADNQTSSTYEKYAAANEFKKGDTVVLQHADHTSGETPDERADTTAVVNGTPVVNGTDSYVPMKLLQADQGNALSATANLTNIDNVQIVGSAYGQGGDSPTAVNYIAQNVYNYTQIFKDTYNVSGTMQASPHRNFDDIIAAERDMAMKMHGIKMEKALIWGTRGTFTDTDTGETAYTTGGIKWFMRNYASSNFFHYALDSAYDGKEWIQAGEDFIDNILEQISLTGEGDSVLALCGNAGLMAINNLIKKSGGSWELTNREGWYGINVKEWVTPVKTLMLKVHPLFNHNPIMRRSMVILKPENIKAMPLPGRDTTDSEVGTAEYDGYKGQFLTELGFEISHPEEFAWVEGLGLDNP